MEEEEIIPERKAPIRHPGDARPQRPIHSWIVGVPYIDGENFGRKDICSRCGGYRIVIMKPNQRPWFDHYVLDGVKFKKAPICNPKK